MVYRDLQAAYQDVVSKFKESGNQEAREALADYRDMVLDLREENQSLKDEIEKLKEQLSNKEKMKFDGLVYRKEGDDKPFCQKCYDDDSKSVYVIKVWNGFDCKVCGNHFDDGTKASITNVNTRSNRRR